MGSICNSLWPAALSGALLFLSFPKWPAPFICWVALVPLYLCLKRPAIALLQGLVCGAVFFLGVFHWIFQIPGYTYLHHLLLAIYLGSYIGGFAWALALLREGFGNQASLAAAPFIWVAIEWLRSNFFFLALPWALLSHSQYQNRGIAQIASVFGAWGVSFLIVLVNAGLAALLFHLQAKVKDGPVNRKYPLHGDPDPWPLVAAALILIAGALGYGYWATERQVKGNPIQIAAIQGNIVQIKKWDPANARSVMQVYQDLTLEAARNSPTLIIWPETATPGSVSLHPELLRQVQALAGEVKAPILFGSTEGQKAFLGARDLHNSAFLAEPTAPSAPPAQMYHKIRLFPFGEYLPLKGVIPWSWIGVPELWSHIPGSQYFLFRIDAIRFGVTICWESLFPDHVRQFVGQGAQFIVNITNEAWFGDTAAPEQFLSMNVFRAIENGVYLIRCGNSGITCIIDPRGRVVARVSDTSGKESFVRGVLTGEILPLSPGTVYTRWGDWFPGVCGLVAAVFILAALFKRWSLRSPQAMRTDADPRMLPGLRD